MTRKSSRVQRNDALVIEGDPHAQAGKDGLADTGRGGKPLRGRPRQQQISLAVHFNTFVDEFCLPLPLYVARESDADRSGHLREIFCERMLLRYQIARSQAGWRDEVSRSHASTFTLQKRSSMNSSRRAFSRDMYNWDYDSLNKHFSGVANKSRDLIGLNARICEMNYIGMAWAVAGIYQDERFPIPAWLLEYQAYQAGDGPLAAAIHQSTHAIRGQLSIRLSCSDWTDSDTSVNELQLLVSGVRAIWTVMWWRAFESWRSPVIMIEHAGLDELSSDGANMGPRREDDIDIIARPDQFLAYAACLPRCILGDRDFSHLVWANWRLRPMLERAQWCDVAIAYRGFSLQSLRNLFALPVPSSSAECAVVSRIHACKSVYDAPKTRDARARWDHHLTDAIRSSFSAVPMNRT